MFTYNTEFCLFVYEDKQIKILLKKMNDDIFYIPGKLVSDNKTAKEEVEEFLSSNKINNSFLRHIAIFDEPNRDFRGNVISNIFYAITKSTNIRGYTFVNINDIGNFNIAYDQKEIVLKAIENIKKDLLETQIAKYFLDEEFGISELQKLLQFVSLESDFYKTHFFTKLKKKSFIEEVRDENGNQKTKTVLDSKRPIKLYRFKKKEKLSSIYF